uniref:Uncharacterized protein n=1 Tax=Pseudonaja textilis TaxID=8673 RepID=A0A670YHP5_PSETE
MPENASTKGAFLNAATGKRNPHGNRSSYQDKDKPTQICFSNISAGKGDGRSHGLYREGGGGERVNGPSLW